MVWLVIDNAQKTIANIIEYDGVQPLVLPPTLELVKYTGSQLVSPGWAWNGTDPVPPPVPEIKITQPKSTGTVTLGKPKVI